MVWERTQPAIQEMVDDAPKAKQYYSDALDAYDRLWYLFGRYEVSEGKTDTYSRETIKVSYDIISPILLKE